MPAGNAQNGEAVTRRRSRSGGSGAIVSAWLLPCGSILVQGVLVWLAVAAGAQIRIWLYRPQSPGQISQYGIVIYATIAAVCVGLGTVLSVLVMRRLLPGKEQASRLWPLIQWHLTVNTLAYVVASELLSVRW